MKSRTQLIITSLLFSTLFLSACKKDIASPSDESKQLFGTWEWIGSSGGITGGGMPESVDNIHSLEFNKNGKVNKYQKGKKVGHAKFNFEDKHTITPNGTMYYLNFKNITGKIDKQRSYYYIINDGILYLSPNDCYDCYSHHYKRK